MDKLPKNALGLITEMTRPYKKRLAGFFLLTFIGISAWAASPFVVRNLINELTHTNHASHYAWFLVALFMFFRLCDEWFWRMAEVVMKNTKPAMIERMRTLLFDYTLHKPHSFFVNSSSGQLGHWINQTNSTLNDTVDNTIWGVWPQSTGLLLSAVFLFISNWILATIFVVWILVLFTYTIKRGRTFGDLVELESDSRSKATGMVVDALSNHLSVRVFNSRQRELEHLSHQQDDIIKKWKKSWRYHIVSNAYKGHSVALAGAIAFTTILMLFNKHAITVGDVTLFIAYFTAAANSVWELAWQLDMYYRSFGTIQNAINGLKKGELERRVEGDVVLPKTTDVILKNLEFYYPDQPNQKVLHNINLSINNGERIGLVGHSGAGKTTLVGLLLGFYEPTAGEFTIGGTATKELGPNHIRDLIAFVPQDTNLFNRTVAQNIAYAKPNATKKQIEQAAKDAQALEFIQKLPDGFETMIGERGVKLSGGQRQRIAIARALLKDAPLLLLDEATSALDSVSEQAIQKAFVTAMKGRTAVVVAHRLSTLRHLDCIVVFDAGTIAEQGTHDQLVAKNGIYADLWRRQKDGFIAE